MGSKLTRFRQWLKNQRHFRVAWFDKDPHLTPEPEEALAQLPNETSDGLKAAINELPPHPVEQEAILKQVDDAIAHWQAHPHLANNSIVILAHPVSPVARVLTEGLDQLCTQSENSLPVKLLDWVERPPNIKQVKSEIEEKLGWAESDFPSEDGISDDHNQNSQESGETSKTENSAKEKGLAVIPNLGWCFLRSVEGLEGVDYLQETLLSDRTQFWIIGSGQVAWEYLRSTLKLHAYCGDTVALPKLTGEQLQDWLKPIITKFDIRFSDVALHKRFQDPDSLLEMNLSIDKPIEAFSEITQEVSATLRSSVRAVKDELLPKQTHIEENVSPRHDYFERIAEISDGVSVVALQLFIKSLRYREIDPEELKNGSLSHLLKDSAAEDLKATCIESANSERANPDANGSGTDSSDNSGSHTNGSSTNDSSTNSSDTNGSKLKKPSRLSGRQLIAITPKLPALPDLSQSDLYLLYSLMLHGDLTIRALAESLGDAPQVVNNQVQVLRNANVIEQKDGVVKTNPVHYPKLRRELAKNNFIIEVS